MFGIDKLGRHLDDRLDQILARLADLERAVNLMPTDADLQAALSAFSTAVTQAVTAASTRVTTDINALKAQIANGTPVTQADLDAVTAAQTAALSGIANIDPANPVPPPVPTPTPIPNPTPTP